MPIYTVFKETRFKGGPPNRVTVWEGDSIDELSKKFPPSSVPGCDKLATQTLGRHTEVTTTYWEQADGKFKQIDDPRKRITPITPEERDQQLQQATAPSGVHAALQLGGYECSICEDRGCDQCLDEDSPGMSQRRQRPSPPPWGSGHF